jgi:hypothetical protein
VHQLAAKFFREPPAAQTMPGIVKFVFAAGVMKQGKERNDF